jgi:CSLREA domain-containing protein
MKPTGDDRAPLLDGATPGRRRSRAAAGLGALLTALLGLAAAAEAAGATFTVTSAGDETHSYPAGTCSDPCTLRDAILAANADPDADSIRFAIPGSGPFTISPLTPLPDITARVAIDGYTQPGARPNALAVGDDAMLLVELSGAAGGEAAPNGLRLVGGSSGSSVRGLVINDFAHDGIVIAHATGVTIAGNFVGVDPTGTIARSNDWGGVFAYDGAVDCVIGGLTAAERNLISGNAEGVTIGNSDTTGVTVRGNYIGTDASGSRALGNLAGVTINGSSGNTVGGTLPGAGNVLSGNSWAGIRIGNGANGNFVQGNLIGTDASGSGGVANHGPGLWLYDGPSGAADDNTVGGTLPAAANVIAFNAGPGVAIESFQGKLPTGNALLGNSIRDNSGLAIDLGNDGVTANDPGDTDTGENGLQNFPLVLTAARTGSALRVFGTLDSTPDQTFTVQLYANAACDASGHGEAQRLLTTTTVQTDGSGHAEFTKTLGPLASRGETVAATATDAAGGTSELSPCRTVGWGVLRRVLPAAS